MNKGSFRPVAIVFQNEEGERIVGRLERINVGATQRKTGGAPAKTLRDVALVLHQEFLTGPDGIAKELAKRALFNLFFPDRKHDKPEEYIRRRAKQCRSKLELEGYSTFLASRGGAPDERGVVVDRVLAVLRPCEAHARLWRKRFDALEAIDVEGYAVQWGITQASFGRGSLKRTSSGFDLDLT